MTTNRQKRVFLWGFWVWVVLGMFLTGCGKRGSQNLTLLVHAPKPYLLWLQTQLQDFTRTSKWKVQVQNYGQCDDLLDLLNLEKGAPQKSIAVAEIPMELGSRLISGGYLSNFNPIGDSRSVTHGLSAFEPRMLWPQANRARTYLFPDRAELFLLAYLKTPLQDVEKNWELYKREFSFVMMKYNHWGVPANFKLEADPDKWNFYDLAFMGYYWAARPYRKQLLPRIAHRGLPCASTVNELAARVFELGGTRQSLFNFLSDANLDQFQWEGIFVKEGFYNAEMWENNWTGADLVSEFLHRTIFLSYFTPEELFDIFKAIETDSNRTDIQMSEVDLSLLPRGCSLELGKGLRPVRTGKQESGLYVWYWGIPKTFKNKKIAFKLIQFLSSDSLQSRALREFGRVPTRRRLVENAEELVRSPWKRTIFGLVRRQIREGVQTLPIKKVWPQVGAIYMDAWDKICVNEQLTNRTAIENELKPFQKDVQAILVPDSTVHR